MANTTQSLTVPAREQSAKTCSCGCAPCEGTCCQLDCLVKPRFFCGQLLTDADLSALVGWARDKFGLTRYRHGWGVVCGLDVRYAGDARHPVRVAVSPGYAVGCCGDDIIICEEATLDLSACCREEQDPCADLRRLVGDQTSAGMGTPARAGGEDAYETGDTSGDTSGDDASRVRAVDIFLRYDEKPSEPATALGRGSCKQVSECEYSRTQESYKLTCEIGVANSNPVAARAARWHEAYEKCLDVLVQFRSRFSQKTAAGDAKLLADDVRRWLLNWIARHPLQQFSNLQDKISALKDADLADERGLTRLIFYLVQDCRNAYLNCDCAGCGDADTGVPLARVWLRLKDDGGGCQVLAIDPYPPYRRPIQPECWPAPPGYANVGRFIWHRWDEVCPALDDLGLRVNRQEFKLPTTLAELEKSLRCDLFINCDEERVALVYDAGPMLGERVVGFCANAAPPPPPPPPPNYDLTIVKDCKASRAAPGETVDFFFSITNTGEGDFQNVRVEDKRLNFGQNIGLLAAGESRTLSAPFTLPPDATSPFRNEAVATGTTADGKTITRTATFSLNISRPVHPGLSVRKSASQQEARVGDTVLYMFYVSNDGDVDLTVDVKDSVLGMIAAGVLIAAHQQRRFEKPFDVKENAAGVFSNEVVVRGTAADGQSVEARDSHTLNILQRITPEPRDPVFAPDNLKDLDLIGPAREATLNKAGIKSFADLAATSNERLREILPDVNEDLITGWIEEAKRRLG